MKPETKRKMYEFVAEHDTCGDQDWYWLPKLKEAFEKGYAESEKRVQKLREACENVLVNGALFKNDALALQEALAETEDKT